MNEGIQDLISKDQRWRALEIYKEKFKPDIEPYSRTLLDEIGIEYKMFESITCLPEIPCRDLRDYPFIADFQTLILDNFAENLISQA
jgi:hypothetical protein